MLKQLFQVLSISIIGGADGPTSIYVSSAYLWQFLLCVIALIVFGIYRLIKNIKNRKKYLTNIKINTFYKSCFML